MSFCVSARSLACVCIALSNCRAIALKCGLLRQSGDDPNISVEVVSLRRESALILLIWAATRVALAYRHLC